MYIRIAALLFLLQLPLHAQGTPGDQTGSDPGVELQWNVSVRRVHRPILIRHGGGDEAGQSACSDLRPDQFDVFEDGEPLPVTSVGPRPQTRTHALLIDTSDSMRARLREAKRAATAYVETIPPDDAALVAGFDDSLVLGSPVTLNRQPGLSAIERLQVGTSTALWDSLYQIIEYLSTLDGERVIILISDGGDTSQLTPDAYQNVLEMITATPDLLIFPIGINLSDAAQPDGVIFSDRLRELATRTGGELFRLRSINSLAGILQQIHRRLDARQYVSYVPRPFGEGPKDRPDLNDYRWRKVKVREKSGTRCGIEALGYSLRLEARDDGSGAALQTTPALEADVSHVATALGKICPLEKPGLQLAEKLRFSPRPYGNETPRDPVFFYTTVAGQRLIEETTDVVVERGVMFRGKSYWGAGKLRPESDRDPVFDRRTIVVETPSLDLIRTELTGPEGVVAYMLGNGLCAPLPDLDHPYLRAPVFVHGRTFLETRDDLGRVLLRAYPQYREWATAKVEASMDSKLQDLMQGNTPLHDLSESDVAALRHALLLRETDPEVGRMGRNLTEWLGDVSALETVRSLERTMMNRVLAAAAGTDLEAASGIDLLEDSWPKLALWFAPATSARVITPMIPAYDVKRGVIGFYRFVLPRPTADGNVELVYDRPFGLLTMRWLVGRPGIAELLSGCGEVASLKIEPTNRKKTRGLVCPGDTGQDPGADPQVLLRSVTFEMQGIGVEAFFHEANDPVCFDVSPRGEDSTRSTETVDRLRELLARSETLAAQAETRERAEILAR